MIFTFSPDIVKKATTMKTTHVQDVVLFLLCFMFPETMSMYLHIHFELQNKAFAFELTLYDALEYKFLTSTMKMI